MATIMYKGKNYKVPNGTIRICENTIEINSKDINQYPTISTADFIGEGLSKLVMALAAIVLLGAYALSFL